MSTGIIQGNVAALNLVQVTVDLGSVAANTSEEETFTLPGAKVGDAVFVAKSDLDAGIILGSARVSATDTVSVQVVNTTASPVDAASETMQVLHVRSEGIPADQTKLSF